MFTAQLGTIDSRPGNIKLGTVSPLRQSVSQNLSLTQTVSMVGLQDVSQSLSLSQIATGHVARSVSVHQGLVFGQFISPGPGFGESAMSFTGRLGTADSKPGNLELGVDSAGGGGGGSLTQTVAQALEFAQQALTNQRPVSASSTLAFSSTATARVNRPAAASNALTFTQTAVRTLAAQLATSTLAFVSTGSAIRALPRSASNALAFAQTTHVNIINAPPVSQSMSLSGVASVHVTPVRVSLSQNLNLVQVATPHLSVINKAVAQVLGFSDMVGRVLTASVSQSISFTQVGERKNLITQSLGLTQLARAGKGGDVDQTLALVQTIIHKAVFRRTIAQALGLQQSVTYWVQRDCTLRQYSPFVGSSSDAGYTAPSTTPPTLARTRLTLTYPYTSPTTTLELRNPEFGDKDRLNFNRINRETRGGTLVVFADPKWPKNQTLVLQVDNLSQAEAADMLAFIAASLGKEVGLKDWDNRQWRGIITTPDAQVTHVGKHDRSIAFEFQGVVV